MSEVELYGTEIRHAHLEIFFDQVHVITGVHFRPTDDDSVLTNVFFVSHLDHFFGDPQRNAPVTRVCRATGCEDEFADFARIIEGKKLSDSAAHGVPTNNRAVEAEMIEHCR